MNLGADAVYSGMSMKVVEAMAREYIPVIGHIGFVPYRSSRLGGTCGLEKRQKKRLRSTKRPRPIRMREPSAWRLKLYPPGN